jgi:hypothetical protein
MKAVILYDSKTQGGSTEALIDSIGLKLAESGVYVEKAKCKATANYRFVREFDLVILGAPVYYFLVSSQLLGSLIHGNLKKNLKRKKIALFLTCGSSESMATVLYLPQLKIHLISNKILVEKIFAPDDLRKSEVHQEFVDELLNEYNRKGRSKVSSGVEWSDEASEFVQALPGFLQGKFRSMGEEYAESMGYREITLDVLEEARDALGGT